MLIDINMYILRNLQFRSRKKKNKAPFPGFRGSDQHFSPFLILMFACNEVTQSL